MADRLGDNRGSDVSFAFAARARVEHCQNLRGRERPIIKRNFIQDAFEFVVPICLAGGSEEQRERAVILGESDRCLGLHLAVDKNLDGICRPDRRQVIPCSNRNHGRGVDFRGNAR